MVAPLHHDLAVQLEDLHAFCALLRLRLVPEQSRRDDAEVRPTGQVALPEDLRGREDGVAREQRGGVPARLVDEVAERIVAAPGSKSYGRLSVLAGWRSRARILFDIAPAAFVPPPKVISSVVELVPLTDPAVCETAVLQRVTEAAFGQRRKMLRQSLKSLGVDPAPLLDAAKIDPTSRAEDIPVEGFAALARAYAAAKA